MKYINELREGNRMSGIYLCKHRQPAVTKNGKPYENVILQDRTGTIDAKIWEPNSQGIDEFEVFDYIDIVGDVNSFNGALQVSIKRVRKAGEGEYNPADYLPTSRYDIEEMYQTLLKYIHSVKNPYLLEMLENLFVKNQELAKNFRTSSAAKNVHHGFVGGLLEHTLSVTRFCDFMAKVYPILNRDLLISAAILHDIGKTRELSAFPQNDYTDDGQLLGHIMIGAEMVHDEARKIAGFPADLENKLIVYNNNPVDKWCLCNTAVDIDRNDNIQPIKTSKPRRRIDGTAALLDAYVVLQNNLNEYLSLI